MFFVIVAARLFVVNSGMYKLHVLDKSPYTNIFIEFWFFELSGREGNQRMGRPARRLRDCGRSSSSIARGARPAS